jgi:hypothetical protein
MQKMTLRYQDVFVPGGFPQYTYNPRAELQLEEKLGEAKDRLCKLVTVTGHTKSGKTVLAKRVFPSESAVWIDGGTVSAEEDFWQVIVEQLDLFQSSSSQASRGVTSKFGAEGGAEANFLIAKGSGKVSGEIGKVRESSSVSGRTVSSRIVALTALKKDPIPIVIDDFHYVPRELQGGIVRALKPLIFEGVPVVIIAIPHRRYDALKVEREMTGRISPIQIQSWSETELSFIPETGFSLLNYNIPGGVKDMLASDAIGSPHLMQDFCRGICKLLNLECGNIRSALPIEKKQIESVYSDVAETIGRPIFEKLARGPR